MLRRHSAEDISILDAAVAFGVFRPTFYQAQVAFNRAGLVGLLPSLRGPKGGHKVTAEVLDYGSRPKGGRTWADYHDLLNAGSFRLLPREPRSSSDRVPLLPSVGES
jgi:hypothetical protein